MNGMKRECGRIRERGTHWEHSRTKKAIFSAQGADGREKPGVVKKGGEAQLLRGRNIDKITESRGDGDNKGMRVQQWRHLRRYRLQRGKRKKKMGFRLLSIR